MRFIKEDLIQDSHLEVLKRARDTYGFKKQVSVVSEELSELAIVCDKFQRYDVDQEGIKALYDKAAEETADVLVVLNHLFEIFGFDQETLNYWVDAKIRRLDRWLNTSDRSEQTMVDRELPEKEKTCDSCRFKETPVDLGPCLSCISSNNYKPKLGCESCDNYGDYRNFKQGGVCFICVQMDGANYTPKEDLSDEAE